MRMLSLERTTLVICLALPGCRGDAGGAGPQRPTREPLAELPNIVFVLADDLGMGDLGCYNPDSKIPTPRLDAFANQARRFTDAHSPSGVCTPTRYGLLTGRYAWRTELQRSVLWGHSPLLIEPERPTIAKLCRSVGYATACFGKWHLGLGDQQETDYEKPLRPGPLELGFDTFQGVPASPDMGPYVWIVDDRPASPATENKELSMPRRGHDGGGFWRAGPSSPGFEHADLLPKTIDVAIDWIGARATEPAPFFAYVALTAPHTPWMPSESFLGAAEAGPYGDFVAMVDAELGRLFDELERLNLVDETLVIVTSDNGAHWEPGDIRTYDHRANLHLRGQKGDAFEGGHRVPYLLRWPGRAAAGSVEDRLHSLTDTYATLASLFGVPKAGAAPDSVDAAPLWLGEPSEPGAAGTRASMVQHSFEGMFALRSGRYKLIAGLGSGGFSSPVSIRPEPDGPIGQLFDLESDPSEQHNLFLEQPEIVARIAEELRVIVETE